MTGDYVLCWLLKTGTTVYIMGMFIAVGGVSKDCVSAVGDGSAIMVKGRTRLVCCQS